MKGSQGRSRPKMSHEGVRVVPAKRKYPHRTASFTSASASSDRLDKPVEDNLEVGVYICVEILGSQERKRLSQSIRDKNGLFPHFMLDLRKEPTFSAIIKSHKPIKIGFVTLCKQLPLYLMGLLLELEGEEGRLLDPFNPENQEPQHFWFHINRGVWLLRSLQATALSLSPTSRNVSDLLPSNNLEYAHTRAILDTIQLYLTYCIRWLGNSEMWKPLGISDDMVSHKARIFQLTMNTLSLFEDYFSWASTDTSFHIHVKDVLLYNSIDSLIQNAFNAMTLVVKEMKLFELEYSALVGNYRHLWQYDVKAGVLKGVTRWYFERLCSVMSFFTRQFLNEAFYCRVMVSKGNAVAILRFMQTVLDEALRFSVGQKIDIHDFDKYLYLLLRVLDLFDVFLEKEELYFLDYAMSHEETKQLLENLVQTIQRLYVCVCIHIKDKQYDGSSFEPIFPRVPTKLISTFQVSLFRVLQVLGDDSNFRDFVLSKCQLPTFLLCDVNRKAFYEYWLNIASGTFRSRKEDRRNKVIHELFGGFEIGIYCLQAREHYDTLAAGLSLYEPLEDIPAGTLVDFWHYEKTLQLYKIILDMQNAKCLAQTPRDESFSNVLDRFSEPEYIRGNMSNLFLFAHNQIPSQLLLQEEIHLCRGVCEELEIKEDHSTQPNSITFMTGSFSHIAASPDQEPPPPETSGARLSPQVVDHGHGQVQIDANPQANSMETSKNGDDLALKKVAAAQLEQPTNTRDWVAHSPIVPHPKEKQEMKIDLAQQWESNLGVAPQISNKESEKGCAPPKSGTYKMVYNFLHQAPTNPAASSQTWPSRKEEEEKKEEEENASTTKKVFVSQIPLSALRTDVERAMAKVGEITSCRMLEDRETGAFNGYALVEYSDSRSAMLAFETHENAKAGKCERLSVNGNPVNVHLYQTPVQKKRTPCTKERKEKISMALKEAWKRRKQKGEVGSTEQEQGGAASTPVAKPEETGSGGDHDPKGNHSNTKASKEDKNFHIELLFEELDIDGRSPDLLLHFFYEHR